MVDVAFRAEQACRPRARASGPVCGIALKRKSTAAFLMTLPLILLIAML